MNVADVSSEAVKWLRRQLERLSLAGTTVPQLVNPRSQGWVYGFARALGEELVLPEDKRYELEARLFVGLFDGSPMGEQLGLEALAMAKQMELLPGAKAMRETFRSHMTHGAEGARCFVALERSLDGFRKTFV